MASLGDRTDVNLGTLAAGQSLVCDGTDWMNGAVDALQVRQGIVSLHDRAIIGSQNPTTITDWSDYIETAAAKAHDEKKSLVGPELANGYCCARGMAIEDVPDMDFRSPIVYRAIDTSVVTFLTLGTASASSATVGRRIRLSVSRLNPSSSKHWTDWTDDDDIGLRMYNVAYCDIRLDGVLFFTRGAVLIGHAAGFHHNQIELGRLLHSRINLDMRAQKVGTNHGQVSDNIFFLAPFAFSAPLRSRKEFCATQDQRAQADRAHRADLWQPEAQVLMLGCFAGRPDRCSWVAGLRRNSLAFGADG